jgi:flagellar biosynthetic protein FlhB
MTKQQVRDEMRNSEGDPHVKHRIRSMQRSLAMNRMMSSISDASVVITNPTHIAVAIRYDVGAGGAPKIVAVGVDEIARRIRERAHDAGVPVIESKPLARALWRSCDVGDEIPIALYEAVAMVLAFVRRLRGGVLAASALPLPRTYGVNVAALEAVPSRRRRRRFA